MTHEATTRNDKPIKSARAVLLCTKMPVESRVQTYFISAQRLIWTAGARPLVGLHKALLRDRLAHHLATSNAGVKTRSSL